MPLFGRKKDTKKEKADVAAEPVDASLTGEKKPQAQAAPVGEIGTGTLSRVLLNPRITEKATFAAERGAYVFDVAPSATKSQVADAVRLYYKVTPRKVNVVTMPRKQIRSRLRGRFGVAGGGKKAYVYLKEGETIEVI